MTFTALLAFQLYNAAVRKNGSRLMMAARSSLAPLFYGRPHGKYQELLLRDSCLRSMMPDTLKAHVEDTESFSKSGSDITGQGADFLQEEANREVKSFLPFGPTTAETWVKVSNSADFLKNLKKQILEVSLIDTSDGDRKYAKHQCEVTKVRKMVRKSGLFSKPFECSKAQSVSGVELDSQLGSFKKQLGDNYFKYKHNVAISGDYVTQKLPFVCITVEERAKIDSVEIKTKAEIINLCDSNINSMPNLEAPATYMAALERLKAKNAKKDCILALHYEVLLSLEQQTAEAVVVAAEPEGSGE